jgi:flagellar biosynthesis/type III secretory pathway M-ring protein FliF/YscJ
MTGYIVLAGFVFLVVSLFGAFIFGYVKGRKKEQAEQREEALRKAASDKEFQTEKEKIQTEVFGNAADKKSKLSGTGGRDSFNRISDSLRDTAKN